MTARGNITISDYLERRTLFLSFSIRTSACSFTSEIEWTKILEYFMVVDRAADHAILLKIFANIVTKEFVISVAYK